MSLIDTVDYHVISAEADEQNAGRQLTLYALSTCAFCEKAQDYLKKAKLSFSYIFLDDMELETKKALKVELKASFGNIPVFPLLVLNGTKSVSGFSEEKYQAFLSQQ